MKFGQVDDLDKVDFSLPTLDKITKTNLSNLTKGENLKFYFGAPGWSDIKYKGIIYPIAILLLIIFGYFNARRKE